MSQFANYSLHNESCTVNNLLTCVQTDIQNCESTQLKQQELMPKNPYHGENTCIHFAAVDT